MSMSLCLDDDLKTGLACVQLLSCVRCFATPCTVAHQAPVTMRFSRQEYWSGLPYPTQGSLPTPEVKQACTVSFALQADSLLLSHWGSLWQLASVQFSSVLSLICVRLCDPMNCSTPGLPVHHQLQEFTQIHVHRVSDTIQPSNPL